MHQPIPFILSYRDERSVDFSLHLDRKSHFSKSMLCPIYSNRSLYTLSTKRQFCYYNTDWKSRTCTDHVRSCYVLRLEQYGVMTFHDMISMVIIHRKRHLPNFVSNSRCHIFRFYKFIAAWRAHVLRKSANFWNSQDPFMHRFDRSHCHYSCRRRPYTWKAVHDHWSVDVARENRVSLPIEP